VSGTLTQAPKRTSHRVASNGTTSSDHLIHIPRAPRGTTPNILRVAAAAAGVLALIAAVVLTGSASGARSEIGSVRTTDAPSVRATDDFLFQLQDMDAQLVNVLLVNGDSTVHVRRPASEALYERDRKAADGDLEAATVALAGNTTALAQLHDVSDAYGQYQAQAVRTLAADERDGGTVAGAAPATVLADYQAAHSVLFGSDGRSGLMQAADGLEQTSKAAIDASAASASDSLTTVVVEFLAFGTLLVGGLVVLQVYVYRRFRRTLNPTLGAATVVALVFMIGGAIGAGDAASDFHTGKSDAFDSVLALSEAGAVSAGINSDESRWLLTQSQPQTSAGYEKSFLLGEQAIADVPGGTAVNTYAQALDQEAAQRSAANLDQTPMTGASSFGKEFHNITFPGEADKASAAFTAYNAYIQDDMRLRSMPLNTPEGLKAAIDFDTNADTTGTSDQTFTAYTQELQAVIDINDGHFKSAMPAAENGIGTWTWLPYVLAVLLFGLTVLGLRPRLNEYR
jgi:hypothetical protein